MNLTTVFEAFGVSVDIIHFPNNFINIDTLNYVGNKPNFEYYEGIDLETWNKLDSQFNTELVCTGSLISDLNGLLNVMNEFRNEIPLPYIVKFV